jgi:prepilin signal peptidase PulO-like enzyme (type II secretory pathway)
MNKIEVPLSKTKILLTIGGSVLFVVLGFYFVTTMADQQTRFNPTIVKGVGIASILFFGATGIYGIRKMFDKSVGLTIDDNGIIDNTNATSIGLIKWYDITEIKTAQVMSTKILLIFTKDPDKILEKVSGMKRKLMAGNMKMYGTPLSITSTTLKYNFDDLEKLLKDRLNEQCARMPNR